MEVRRVSLDDVQPVFELYCEVSAEGKYPARTNPPSIETFERALAEVEANGWPVYVVEHAAELVGNASVYPESFCRAGGDRHIGFLGMQVKQGFRRRGYGAALLTAVVKHCRDTDFHTIELMVLKSNTAARSLYDSFGFVWVEDLPPCTLGSGVIDHPVRMRLTL